MNYKHRRFHIENISVVRDKLDHVVLLDELHVVADHFPAEADLIVSLCIHVSIKISIRIQILILFSVDPCLREFLSGAESCLGNTAVDHIL